MIKWGVGEKRMTREGIWRETAKIRGYLRGSVETRLQNRPTIYTCMRVI